MDRLYLSDWGRSLSDEDFARALAGLGTLGKDPLAWANNRAYSQRDVGPRFRWEMDSRSPKALPTTKCALAAWQRIRDLFTKVTLFLDGDDELGLRERMTFARTLSTLPEIDGVTIECDDGWTQSLAWRLPYTIATLEGDPIAATLLDFEAKRPPNWPAKFTTADRHNDRHDILCVSESLGEFSQHANRLPARLKAHVLIVNGLRATDADEVQPLMDRLAARLSVSGIALTTRSLEAKAFADCVNELSFQLAHDSPFDSALKAAFGDGMILVANASLLREARTSAQVPRMQARARAMPTSEPLEILPESLNELAPGMTSPNVRGLEMATGAAPSDTVPVPAKAVSDILAKAGNSIRYDSELRGARALTELHDAMRSASADEANATTSLRYVQQQCLRRDAAGTEHLIGDAFVVGEAVSMRVRIGPHASDWQRSNVAFPNTELPPNESSHRLTLMFHEFAQLDAPLLRDVTLPRVGASNEATFEFTPRKTGPFEGRITVIHRGRILQTALLRTKVFSVRNGRAAKCRLEMLDEARVRHDWTSLDQRPRFDLAMVCNRNADASPGMTATGSGHAWATDLTGIQASIKQINSLLSEVAQNTKDYGDGLDKGGNPELLVALAFEGRELFAKLVVDQLAKNADGGFDLRSESVTHIQVVGTRIDEIVPIEFIYDCELSTEDTDPTLCPKHQEALKHGACQGDCPDRASPGKYVCPMGFWGLRKVIERHLFDAVAANTAEGPLVVRSEASRLRDSLGIRNGAVVAHSDRVDSASLAALHASLGKHANSAIVMATSWNDWADAVAKNAPALLIAFPHNDGGGARRTLEVNSTKLRTAALPIFGEHRLADAPVKWYARAPSGAPPLVFLLGCDTASTAEEFGSHVNSFRRAGAAVVVSTVATVFGDHAVAVGTSIVTELLEKVAQGSNAPGTTTTLGEVLREAKRKALLESIPMALCVVAFGDADWRLA